MDEMQDDDVFLNGTLSSPECGIVLELNGTTTHVEEHYAKAINYTLMVTAVSFLQVRPEADQYRIIPLIICKCITGRCSLPGKCCRGRCVQRVF